MPENESSAETRGNNIYGIPQRQYRNPSTFKGDGQDPNKWLKEYDRVAKFNYWDDAVCLANVYFFLEGAAKQWFENNEDQVDSWDKFKADISSIFGDPQHYRRKAEDELKGRAQKSGESTQSYIQSVLGLCQQVQPNMTEDEKISHLMKGIAENMYQALLMKEIKSTSDFINSCQYIEEMHQKRIRGHAFERLPNVVPMAAMDAQPDLVSLVRQIVQEEVQRINIPSRDVDSQMPSLETIIRSEVENSLSPIADRSGWSEVRPKRRPTYAAITRNQRTPIMEQPQRRTDVWRTTDNRPVCFHCGRPGHVVRYCRERKAVFDNYRAERRSSPSQSNQRAYAEDYTPLAVRSSSPGSNRGRSPVRRYRSPSPYRRRSQSPATNGEN